MSRNSRNQLVCVEVIRGLESSAYYDLAKMFTEDCLIKYLTESMWDICLPSTSVVKEQMGQETWKGNASA